MAPDNRENLVVPLERDLFAFVCKQAALAGFVEPGDYVGHLVEILQQLQDVRQLEADIAKGFQSGPFTAMTDSDWRELRERASRQ